MPSNIIREIFLSLTNYELIQLQAHIGIIPYPRKLYIYKSSFLTVCKNSLVSRLVSIASKVECIYVCV